MYIIYIVILLVHSLHNYNRRENFDRPFYYIKFLMIIKNNNCCLVD